MTVTDIFAKQDPLFGIKALWRCWIGQMAPASEPSVEDTRARLDFILEMMDAHPEVFSSDEAFRWTSRHFSGRF